MPFPVEIKTPFSFKVAKKIRNCLNGRTAWNRLDFQVLLTALNHTKNLREIEDMFMRTKKESRCIF